MRRVREVLWLTVDAQLSDSQIAAVIRSARNANQNPVEQWRAYLEAPILADAILCLPDSQQVRTDAQGRFDA